MSNKPLVSFCYYGGKSSHLSWLLPFIEGTPHNHYVEPFGGSAAVLLNKTRSSVETLNDINGDIIHFFRTLRNQKTDLVDLLRLTPYSREEFTIACQHEQGLSDLERARRFYVLARMAMHGKATKTRPSSWSRSLVGERLGPSKAIRRWFGGIEQLEEVACRLLDVQIECRNALKVLLSYDGPNTLFYLDPPYLMETRSGDLGYANEMTLKEHLLLLKIINQLQGKVILSGYDHPVYTQRLPGWHVFKTMPMSSSSSNLTDSGSSGDREEVLWTNYPVHMPSFMWESSQNV